MRVSLHKHTLSYKIFYNRAFSMVWTWRIPFLVTMAMGKGILSSWADEGDRASNGGYIYFCLLSTGVHFQIQLVESGVELRKSGFSVKVSCKASRYTFTCHAMKWCDRPQNKSLSGWVGSTLICGNQHMPKDSWINVSIHQTSVSMTYV